MPQRELTDDEVFGAAPAQELSDADVFGTAPAPAPRRGPVVGEMRAYNPSITDQLGEAFNTLIGKYDDRPLIARIQDSTGRVVDAVTPDALQRGMIRGKQGMALGMDLAGIGPRSVYDTQPDGVPSSRTAVQLADLNRQAERYAAPEERQQTLQNISQSKSVGDLYTALAQDPGQSVKAIGDVVLESLGVGVPSLMLAAGGSALGPGGTAAGAGLGSFGTEYTQTIMQKIQERGGDPGDPNSWNAAFNDAAFMADAKQSALERGIPVAAFDALTAGVAGKFMEPAKGIPQVLIASGKEAAVQSAGGALGEATAQKVDEGKITSVGDVALEAIAEIPSAVVETTSNVLNARNDVNAQPELSDAEVFGGQVPPAAPTSPAPAEPAAAPPPVEPQPVEPAGAGATTPPAEPQAPAPAPAQAQQPVQAPTEPQPAAQPVAAPAAPEGNRRTVTTASGRKVDTEFQVVDLATLQAATGDLQNRDRSRATSDLQIQDIASKLDPERLGDSAEADRGAPIIGPDNIVESGNGRVAAIRKAYESIPERAEAYKQFLAKQGYSTEGMAQPVLVRRRMTDMTPEERRAFIIEANTSSTARLNAVEQAKSDADLVGDDVLQLYKGGEFGAAGNRDFVRNMIGKLPQSEQSSLFGTDGNLSQEGVRRIQNAMLARAYGDANLLSKFTEDPDNNIRSIGGAMLDVSGSWAQLRADVRAGRVKPEFDITNDIVAAAQRISTARERGETVQQVLGQTDAFNQMSPLTEKLIRTFYSNDLSRAASREKISESLRAYAEQAQQQTTEANLFGDLPDVTPEQLLDAELGKRVEAAPPTQASMFGAGGKPAVQVAPEPQAKPEPPKAAPEDLEARAKALEPKVNALSMEDVKRALQAIGEKPRVNKDPYEQLMSQHPDDIEQALAAVQAKPEPKQKKPDPKVAKSKIVDVSSTETGTYNDGTTIGNIEYIRGKDASGETVGIVRLYDESDNLVREVEVDGLSYFDSIGFHEDVFGPDSEAAIRIDYEQTPEEARTETARKVAEEEEMAYMRELIKGFDDRQLELAYYRATTDPDIDYKNISADEARKRLLLELNHAEMRAGVYAVDGGGYHNYFEKVYEDLIKLTGAKQTSVNKKGEPVYSLDVPQAWQDKYFDEFGRPPFSGAFELRNKNKPKGDVWQQMKQPKKPAVYELIDKRWQNRVETKKGKGSKKKDGPMEDTMSPDVMEDTIDDADIAELEQEPQQNQRGRNATPETMRVSFTNRRSWAEQAFRDAGVDPDEATLWPIERQFEVLTGLVQGRFGITVKKSGTLPSRFAVDQMLDLYRNLQFMAHVMGLPANAMGLRDTLTLVFRKGIQYFGAFYSGPSRVEGVSFPAGTIVLPRRSNSFAHEWGHALDHYLVKHFGETNFNLLSQKVKKEGLDYQPNTVKEAFVSLMDHLFYDQASLAAKILALELALENPNISASAKKKAEEQLANLKRGNARPKDVDSSTYKQTSAGFDPSNPDYWANPQEMLARAFEAYTAFKVEMAGGSTEAIAKGDMAYLSTADKRLAETFPKGDERFRIFAAFDRLFAMMAKEQIIADGVPAGVPNNVGKFDPNIWHRTPADKDEYKGIFGAVKQTVDEVKASVDRMKREAARPDNPKPLGEQVQDVLKEGASVEMAVFRIFEKRNPSSRAVKELANMLVPDPGTDRVVKRVFEDAADMHFKAMINRLSNIVERYDLQNLNEAETKQLRDLLISENVPGAPSNLRQAATELRRLLDTEWYRNQEAGLEIGYTKNGFLPRLLDMARVMTDRLGFIKAASKVYEIIFDKEFGADAMEVMDRGSNYSGVVAFLKQANKAGLDFKPAIKLVRQLRRLARQLQSAKDPDAVQAKIDDLNEQLLVLIEALYDNTRTYYGQFRAQAWHTSIMTADTHDFDAMAPDAQYTKSRKLPPETDKIMENFYLNDPLEVIQSYFMQSARRTEYARRFGPRGEKLQKIFEAMTGEGVSPEDQAYMSGMVARLTGRQRHDLSATYAGFLSGVQAIGIITILPRAVWSSLGEPVMAGVRTGEFKNIFLPHFNLIKQIVGTADSKDWAEIARVIGLVTNSMADTLAANRFGGNFGDSARMQRVMANFGKRSGLHGITNASRIAILPLQHEHLLGLARRIRDKRDVANSEALLHELGVSDIKGFTDWLLQSDRLPTIQELFDDNGVETQYGADWITAIHRISDQTIQNPRTYNRPKMANNPHGRLIYSILSFSMTFYENVWKRTGKQLAGMSQRTGKLSAAQYAALNVLPAMVGLFIAQTLVSTLREAIFNPERWEEWEKEGVLFERLLQLGFVRSFSFGLADVPIQGFTGLKYQRDLSNMMIGAVPSYFLQALQGMAQPVVSNSDKTNNAEYKSAQSAYQLIAAPALAYGLSVVPGGRLLDPLYGGLMQYLTAPASRDAVADAVVGEKDSRVKARERAERKADKADGGRSTGRSSKGRETGRETGRD